MKTLRLALAQINQTVGDLTANRKKIIDYLSMAEDMGADVAVFPELAITGYPPEDLLLKPSFINDNMKVLEEITGHTGRMAAVVGFVDRKDDIYNAAALLYRGEVRDVYHKIFLPNYGVFDEMRYFRPGKSLPLYEIHGVTVGVSICEDIWYPDGPAYQQALNGAEVILNINASPYGIHKAHYRQTMLTTRAIDNAAALAYLNMAGGQDELVFDGHSLVIGPQGDILARGKQFEEELLVVDIDCDRVFLARLHDPRRRQKSGGKDDLPVRRIFVHNEETPQRHPLCAVVPAPMPAPMEEVQEVYGALVMGTRDYVHKNGFTGAVIGLSGGIDSSLVATVAVDALGKHNVTGIFMPSPYTSLESREDAYTLARNLDITIHEVPIINTFTAYLEQLAPFFKDTKRDTTEENLQARIRGNILMAFSNKFGSIVLTTGNKSEMSVGYATLYGDMAGGFAVIKDVPKTLVYELARYCNGSERGEIIPHRVLVKAPTAELRENQKDTDSLPPYDVLDPILESYVEKEMFAQEILLLGYGEEEVRRVLSLIDKNEYKRRQAPPGIKITRRAFGRDRRFPLTNRYRGY